MLAFTKNKPTNQKNNKNLCWSFKNMQSQNHKPTMFMSVMNMFENAIYFCTLDWLSRLRWCTEEYINMISKYYCTKMTSEWTEPSFHEDGQTVPKLPHMTGVSGLHSQQVTVVELAVPAKYSTGVLRTAWSTGQNGGFISSTYDPYIQQVYWGLHCQHVTVVDSLVSPGSIYPTGVLRPTLSTCHSGGFVSSTCIHISNSCQRPALSTGHNSGFISSTHIHISIRCLRFALPADHIDSPATAEQCQPLASSQPACCEGRGERSDPRPR